MRRVYTLHTLEGYLARRDVPCPSCGYNLRGLSEGTCPECGFGFDVESLKALRTPRPLIVEWAIDHVVAAIVLLTFVNETISIFALERPERRAISVVSAVIILALVLPRAYAELQLGESDDGRSDRLETVCGVLAVAQSLLLLAFLIRRSGWW